MEIEKHFGFVVTIVVFAELEPAGKVEGEHLVEGDGHAEVRFHTEVTGSVFALALAVVRTLADENVQVEADIRGQHVVHGEVTFCTEVEVPRRGPLVVTRGFHLEAGFSTESDNAECLGVLDTEVDAETVAVKFFFADGESKKAFMMGMNW